MDILELITKDLCIGLTIKFDEIIIEGLKRKGFVFEDKDQVVEFVKNNCRCEDYAHIKERIYFVNDEAFLLHIYRSEIEMNTNCNLTATYGSYSYL